MRRNPMILLFVGVLLLSLAPFVRAAQSGSGGDDGAFGAAGADWCRTQTVFEERYPNRYRLGSACPLESDCDIAANRDANIPPPDQPLLTIRLKFHIFANDDGSNPAATQAEVDLQMQKTNQDYAPSRINFVYETAFHNSSKYRSWADGEEAGMKNTYAENPDKQCNIYVTYVEGSYSFGTFPWDSYSLGNMGGIVMTEPAFGPGQETLTHELGHTLGLWHTHHGVSEVSQCGPCWERADKTNGDFTGDFCSDTDPTPTNFNCGGPGGTDVCSGTPWGATNPENYMGYAGDNCWTEFSPQQMGRLHCYIASNLTGWLAIDFTGTPREGAESLTVAFDYSTPLTVTAWKWMFGDGDSSMLATPTHTYGPGLFDVSLSITTDVGDLISTAQNFVTVWADTASVTGFDEKADVAGYWEIYGTNAVPVEEFIIPVTLTNVPSVLFLDSISFLGTRLEYFEFSQVVFDNRYVGQLAVHVQADHGGGSPPLPPGSGPIARVHYRTRSFASPGDTTFLTTAPLGVHTFKAVVPTTEYNPVFNGATMRIIPSCACPYQCDFDANGAIDAIDMGTMIDVVFFTGTDPQDPDCLTTRSDFNADGTADAVDLGELIDHVFFTGPPPADPCAP